MDSSDLKPKSTWGGSRGGGRPPKEKKGKMVWVPSDKLEAVFAILGKSLVSSVAIQNTLVLDPVDQLTKNFKMLNKRHMPSIFTDDDLLSKLLALKLKQTQGEFSRLWDGLPNGVRTAALKSHKTATKIYLAGGRVLPAEGLKDARLFWLADLPDDLI